MKNYWIVIEWSREGSVFVASPARAIRYLQMSESGYSSQSLRPYGSDLIVTEVSATQNATFSQKRSHLGEREIFSDIQSGSITPKFAFEKRFSKRYLTTYTYIPSTLAIQRLRFWIFFYCSIYETRSKRIFRAHLSAAVLVPISRTCHCFERALKTYQNPSASRSPESHRLRECPLTFRALHSRRRTATLAIVGGNTPSFYFIATVVASSSYIFDQLFKSIARMPRQVFLRARARASDCSSPSCCSCVRDRSHTCATTVTWMVIDLRALLIAVEIITRVTSDHFHGLTRQPASCKLSQGTLQSSWLRESSGDPQESSEGTLNYTRAYIHDCSSSLR